MDLREFWDILWTRLRYGGKYNKQMSLLSESRAGRSRAGRSEEAPREWSFDSTMGWEL